MFRLRLLQRLPCRSHIVRNRRAFAYATESAEFIDITGYHSGISDPSALALYNDSLTNLLTHEKDPSVQLNLVRLKHKNVGMVNSLLVFQMIRQPKPHDLNERKKIRGLLSILEKSFGEGITEQVEEDTILDVFSGTLCLNYMFFIIFLY